MRELQLRRALAALAQQGIHGRYAFPTPYRVLWLLGLNVRPPLFGTFLQLFAVNTLVFGVLFTVLFVLRVGVFKGIPIDPTTLAVCSFIGALVFGGCMAAVWLRRARKLHLPTWESLSSGV